MRGAAVLVLVAAGLGGCALLGSGPAALDTYELTTPVAESGPRRGSTQILIAEPSALRALDGQNIVIKTAPGSIEFLSGAQWSDRLPRIVQARLAESFQRSERFGGVGQPGEGLAIDYQLVTNLRAFEISVAGQPQAVVEIFARVLNDRNGVVRASRSFRASVPIAGAGNDAYVAALDAAFSGIGTEIVGWVATSI